ncbi:MAG TPA: sugar ABC transporter substrate-binding protein [Burkholderiales bacterium]|nr:sugar ABC transporter substrate-binding protein [Burkholderiales bacterium]
MPGETIAVFTKNRSNPAYDAARLGAERTAARDGARVLHFVPEKADDVDQQVALVEQAIAARPDAVLFVPVHLTALDASVRRLNAAGIPVVNYLNRLANGRFVSFVGADDYSLARAIAACLFRHLGGTGDVVMMEGVAGAVTSRERARGFRDAAAEWPGIRIVATRNGDYQEATARREMASMLAGHFRIDGILSANDAMSLGILSALQDAGQSAPVIGINALPEAIAAVKSGRLLATVDFNAMNISCIATEAALRHLRGQAVPAEIMLPAPIVDRSNCQAWDVPLRQRTCPRWSDVVRGTAEL